MPSGAEVTLDDSDSKREDDVYRELAWGFREIATSLRRVAGRMAAQHDLPMGAHDGRGWTDRHVKAFERFVHEQSALASMRKPPA